MESSGRGRVRQGRALSRDDTVGRSLPENLEVEQAVLGALLIDNGRYGTVEPIVKAHHFREELHRRMFEAIAEGMRRDLLVNALTIRTFLPTDLQVGDMAIGAYIARLVANGAHVGVLASYAGVIRDLAARREIISIAGDMIATAYDGADVDPLRQVEEAEIRLSKVAAEVAKGARDDRMDRAIDASVKAIASAYKTGNAVGSPWCLAELGKVLDTDIEPGMLLGLLAGSMEGKTALALQEVRNQAERGIPTLFLSGEQTVDQCIRQMHAQKLGLPARIIKEGLRRIEVERGRDEFERAFVSVEEDARKIKALPLVIQEWDEATPTQLMARARAFERTYGRCFVVVDHAQATEPEDSRANLAEQVSGMYRIFKRFGMARGSSLMILTQRNMESKKRENASPGRMDMYGGERAIQAFDAIVALFREEIWLADQIKVATTEKERTFLGQRLANARGKAEFHTIKSRFGERRAKQTVDFVGQYTRFASQGEDPETQQRMF